ncbi:MAG: macro domain-containing protein [Lachnospiraceae bacterium]|nr:macro domain-containing protein [Lachnospiraceae bacterium]
MLKYVEGNLFGSPAQVLVNTVNTVGVMGKGIALEFKKRYPEMFNEYKEQCDKHRLVVGKLMLWYEPDHWLLLFPTKEHWRNPSKLEYIEKGLMAFTRKYADYNISSIAFPKLGCGNGELDWNDVKPLMEKYLKDLPIDVFIYLGLGETQKPEHKCRKEMEEFLTENAIDLSFTGVKDMIGYRTMMAPVEIEFAGEVWRASWEKDGKLSFENGSDSIAFDTETVHRVWDEITTQRLFSVDKADDKAIIYCLLNRMGYLQQVRVSDENEELKEGYQLERGKGQAYIVKGE